jgi:hypothetical protein
MTNLIWSVWRYDAQHNDTQYDSIKLSFYCHAECRYAECRGATQYSMQLFIIMLSVVKLNV